MDVCLVGIYCITIHKLEQPFPVPSFHLISPLPSCIRYETFGVILTKLKLYQWQSNSSRCSDLIMNSRPSRIWESQALWASGTSGGLGTSRIWSWLGASNSAVSSGGLGTRTAVFVVVVVGGKQF